MFIARPIFMSLAMSFTPNQTIDGGSYAVIIVYPFARALHEIFCLLLINSQVFRVGITELSYLLHRKEGAVHSGYKPGFFKD